MTAVANTSETNNLHTLLKYVFVIVPIVAGLDKYFNILVQWDTYLAPSTLDLLPFSGETFMKIVGIIEVIAGIIVALKTQIGAYIVSIWLLLIALSLILTWWHPDVGVRDIVMAISAYVLAKLSSLNKGKAS